MFDWTEMVTKENLLWQGDERRMETEHWRDAWLRLFGEPVPYLRNAWASYDNGECLMYWFAGGRILVHDATHGTTSIYQTDVL